MSTIVYREGESGTSPFLSLRCAGSGVIKKKRKLLKRIENKRNINESSKLD